MLRKWCFGDVVEKIIDLKPLAEEKKLKKILTITYYETNNIKKSENV